MDEFIGTWSHTLLAGLGFVVSGAVLFFLKRSITKQDEEEEEREAWRTRVNRTLRRHERNLERIQDHSNVKLEIRLEMEE